MKTFAEKLRDKLIVKDALEATLEPDTELSALVEIIPETLIEGMMLDKAKETNDE